MSPLKEILISADAKIFPKINSYHQPLGLIDGKMGVCIYTYMLSRHLNDANYEVIADHLMDSVCKEIHEGLRLGIESGFAGIGLGFTYLLKNKFIDGEINEILEQFDIPIFKALSFPKDSEKDKEKIDVKLSIELLYYLFNRYKIQQQNSEGEFIFKSLIYKILNTYSFVEEEIKEPHSFSLNFTFPFYLYTLGLLAQISIFQTKVRHIADEITHKVISCWPALHAHRLYLLWGMAPSLRALKLHDWQEHFTLLRRETSISSIIENEIQPHQIFFKHGLSGIWYLLSHYNDNVGHNEQFPFEISVFRDKILSSDTWRKLLLDVSFLRENFNLACYCGTAWQLINNLNNTK